MRRGDREQVRGVHQLVDRTDERQGPQPRVGHPGEGRLHEPVAHQYQESAPEERPDRRLDPLGDPRVVVATSYGLVCRDERPFALRPIRGQQHAVQATGQFGRARQLRERRAEPLHVRPIPAVEQEPQAHQLVHLSCRNHARTQLIPDLGGPADERLFLRHALPLTRNHPAPHVVGIPVQLLTQAPELAEAIVEDGAAHHSEQELLRHHQPVDCVDTVTRVMSQLRHEPGSEITHPNAMLCCDATPPVRDRAAAELRWQRRVDRSLRGRNVCRLDEHAQSWPPPVIGGTLRIEPENLRSPSQQPGAVTRSPQDRCDDLGVERRVQIDP